MFKKLKVEIAHFKSQPHNFQILVMTNLVYALVLPVIDKAGKPWALDGQPVFCLHGTQFETVDDQKIHLARCPDCGGMGIRDDEPLVESDCIRCVQCGHEFDTRLEMMEN